MESNFRVLNPSRDVACKSITVHRVDHVMALSLNGISADFIATHHPTTQQSTGIDHTELGQLTGKSVHSHNIYFNVEEINRKRTRENRSEINPPS